MPERLNERDDVAVVKHRHGDAQIGQVTDAALGTVNVVVEEHVAGPHLRHGEVARDGVNERGVRPARELAQQPIVNAGTEVVRVANHWAATGSCDRGFDFALDAGEGSLDDLDEHRVRTGTGVCGEEAVRELRGDQPRVHQDSRVTIRLRRSSTRTANPGCSGTVDRTPPGLLGRADLAAAQIGSPVHRCLDVPVRGVEAHRSARAGARSRLRSRSRQ